MVSQSCQLFLVMRVGSRVEPSSVSSYRHLRGLGLFMVSRMYRRMKIWNAGPPGFEMRTFQASKCEPSKL